MMVRAGWLLCAVAELACSNDARIPPTGGGSQACLAVDDGSSTCWKQLRPLGTGGFPPEPGSNDSPKWEPGRWPMTLQPVIAFGGELWMVSQTNAWSSSDGLAWTHQAKTDTGGRIWHDLVYFGDRLWIFGGLRYADRVLQDDVWSSRDGATWERSDDAAWSPRARHRVIAFQGRLWLFGGIDRMGADFTAEHTSNDIWSSDDGRAWTQRAAAAPWPPREEARMVVLGDTIFLVGGQGVDDVWRSRDGIEWTQVTAQAGFGPRNDFAVLAFRDRLWVYGGWRGRSTDGLNDIWYSADGAVWTRQTEHAPWGPRSPRTVAYGDRIWIYSGKHTGAADNWGGDIWTMSVAKEP